MRRLPLHRPTLALAALALAGSAVPGLAADRSPLVKVDLGPGAFISENVDYVGTLPIAPGIGGKVLKVGGQQRLYMTGSQGLFIFDVTDPALPRPLGVYHLPHFQNEDVDVSDDGKRVIISTDTAGVDRSGSAANGIHVLDTSNPADIKRVGFINASNHTTTCADAKCEWLYGSSGGGKIFDARVPGAIKEAGTWNKSGSNAHALNRDETGLMISDTNPRLILDVSDPARPKVLASGKTSVATDGLLQHNNVRLDATKWVPRAAGDTAPDIRPGELFIGNSESNLRAPQCGNTPGALSSWTMANFDKGTAPKQLEFFKPVNGTYADGNPAVNALGCSGHWFTVRDNMITASWYEHGVRFIEVDPATGKFTQKGFFQPVATEAGAAHWLTDAKGNEYVYSMDYARGIDILKFNRKAPAPSEEQTTASWLANLSTVGPMAELERSLCRAAGQQAHHLS